MRIVFTILILPTAVFIEIVIIFLIFTLNYFSFFIKRNWTIVAINTNYHHPCYPVLPCQYLQVVPRYYPRFYFPQLRVTTLTALMIQTSNSEWRIKDNLWQMNANAANTGFVHILKNLEHNVVW